MLCNATRDGVVEADDRQEPPSCKLKFKDDTVS
jgi:hypothetical protein